MVVDAIKKAYRIMEERGWDTIYWAIDLHGVCLKSTYVSSTHEWISDRAIDGLRMIAARPENKIILWSGVHEREKQPIIDMFSAKDIPVAAFNCNPFEDDTEAGSFVEKFYFSILLDDKAGFNYMTDWKAIIDFYLERSS